MPANAIPLEDLSKFREKKKFRSGPVSRVLSGVIISLGC